MQEGHFRFHNGDSIGSRCVHLCLQVRVLFVPMLSCWFVELLIWVSSTCAHLCIGNERMVCCADKILSLIGEGTFGRVLECWDRKRKVTVAIKVIRSVPKYREAAMIEVRLVVGCHCRSGTCLVQRSSSAAEGRRLARTWCSSARREAR